VSKETFYSVKRDLLQCFHRVIPSFMCQKRPTTVSKETYYRVKRDPFLHVSGIIKSTQRGLGHFEDSSLNYASLRVFKKPQSPVFPTPFCPWERLRRVSKAIACSRSLYSTVSKETYCSVERDLLQCFEGDSV